MAQGKAGGVGGGVVGAISPSPERILQTVVLSGKACLASGGGR